MADQWENGKGGLKWGEDASVPLCTKHEQTER